MAKLPEGRKPLEDEWFNMWPSVDDFSQPPSTKKKPEEKENERQSP